MGLKYSRLNSSYSNHRPGFSPEDDRFALINYILHQGEVVLRSPLAKGRARPEWREEEFAIILFDGGLYSYYIEPRRRGKDRRMEIVVVSDNEKDLSERVLKLTRNSSFRKEILFDSLMGM